MSLNSLKIATDGYLKKTTKVALIIAVAGYLNGSEASVTPIQSGGDFGSQVEFRTGSSRRNKSIAGDESDLIAIVELTLKHFII